MKDWNSANSDKAKVNALADRNCLIAYKQS